MCINHRVSLALPMCDYLSRCLRLSLSISQSLSVFVSHFLCMSLCWCLSHVRLCLCSVLSLSLYVVLSLFMCNNHRVSLAMLVPDYVRRSLRFRCLPVLSLSVSALTFSVCLCVGVCLMSVYVVLCIVSMLVCVCTCALTIETVNSVIDYLCRSLRLSLSIFLSLSVSVSLSLSIFLFVSGSCLSVHVLYIVSVSLCHSVIISFSHIECDFII